MDSNRQGKRLAIIVAAMLGTVGACYGVIAYTQGQVAEQNADAVKQYRDDTEALSRQLATMPD